ncbi:MAG: hypothetical protein KME47_09820 [Nodosilinea sp. WJT8-NPBG4]|jgi:putative alpha-1,2-mannosidase|nr:hypothetical protein [Nodosilinea sp. WJT8-NPBG4]
MTQLIYQIEGESTTYSSDSRKFTQYEFPNNVEVFDLGIFQKHPTSLEVIFRLKLIALARDIKASFKADHAINLSLSLAYTIAEIWEINSSLGRKLESEILGQIKGN